MAEIRKDERTRTNALVAALICISACPDDMVPTFTSLGRRAMGVGGGWYWYVNWSRVVHRGTGKLNPDGIDDLEYKRAVAIRAAVEESARWTDDGFYLEREADDPMGYGDEVDEEDDEENEDG